MKLPLSFYQREDVVTVARELLGKYLVTYIDSVISVGYIVETEAYNGVFDKAAHSYGGKLTPRTKTMFEAGGVAYVYLCYGIHEMFNVVASVEGDPRAVLIRAVHPTEGLEAMLYRRNMLALKPNITSGPGSVAQALGINRKINGICLQSDTLWLEDRGLSFADDQIAAVPRVGVAYAKEDALLPYRFFVKGDVYVSKPNKY
nr:DNA-3-methyladenine glycosylase [uncultured Mucilaginibacter sp.]